MRKVFTRRGRTWIRLGGKGLRPEMCEPNEPSEAANEPQNPFERHDGRPRSAQQPQMEKLKRKTNNTRMDNLCKAPKYR